MYDPIYDLYEDGYGCSEALAVLQECGVKITLERVAAVYDNYNHIHTHQDSPSQQISSEPVDVQILS